MQKFLFLVLTLSIVQFSFAQKYDIGAIAGISTAQIDGDDHGGYTKLGGHLGGYFIKPLNKKLSLSTQLKIDQKGSRSNFDLESSAVAYFKVWLNYLDVPIQVQYRYNKKWAGEAGLCLGYLIYGSGNFNGYDPVDITDNYNKLDLGATCGLLYKISEKYTFSLSITRSIIPFGQWNDNELVYNNNLLFGMRYSITSDD